MTRATGGPPAGSADQGLSVGAAGDVAIETGSAAWTWDELAEASDALADRLAGLSVRPAAPGSPRIGHVFGLSPESIVVVHAIARSGCVFAPGHVSWDEAGAIRWAGAVSPDVMVVAPGHAFPGRWEREALPLRGFGPVDLLTRLDDDRSGPRGASAPSGTDVMISTSGSGGAPRTVCHSWQALRANARACNRRAGADSASVTLATLAWGHVGGLAIIVRASEAGGRIVCGGGRFDAGQGAEALARHGVTHASVVPVMLERLLDAGVKPPDTLEVILTGGAATSPSLLERALEAGWPVSLTYGLTEAGSQVATATPAEVLRGVPALERPLAGFEIRAGEDGKGGEVFVRGPSLLLGYLETGDALDDDGWFATGDFAALGESGSLSITGRRSTRIVTGGTNVDAEEIEATLRLHQAVRDVCVVGVADERWGEIVTAVVVPREGMSTGSEGGVQEELETWSRQRFDGARRPRRWRIVDALPRTATGKVDRVTVRADASRESSDGPASSA